VPLLPTRRIMTLAYGLLWSTHGDGAVQLDSRQRAGGTADGPELTAAEVRQPSADLLNATDAFIDWPSHPEMSVLSAILQRCRWSTRAN
jgi:hypothetical protein